jgi:DNA invertase Pin-like site-specific DNA recombinase
MTPPISAELRGRILDLGAQKYSSLMISKELGMQNFSVSQSTVSKILKNYTNGDGNPAISGSLTKKKRRPDIRTPGVIKKVRNFIAFDNPPTQREMARRVGASQSTIHRIIHQNLNSKKKVKVKVHHLDERMIVQRKERALNFHNFIANGNYKDVLTMD